MAVILAVRFSLAEVTVKVKGGRNAPKCLLQPRLLIVMTQEKLTPIFFELFVKKMIHASKPSLVFLFFF